jgi:predicted dehydrogenase
MSFRPASSVLRVGIVGSGGIARMHALGWNAFPGAAKITAIAEIDAERARAFSEGHTGGEARVFGSLHDMLSNDVVDVVDICLPHHLHTEAIIASAQAGKAILCEKPLCTNLADARRIMAALEEFDVPFMSGHNQLFQPSLLEARRLLATGTLGRPFIFRSIETFQSRLFDPHSNGKSVPGGGQLGWRTDITQAGGGELLDTGYHSTYRLLSLANNDRPIEVTGFLSRFLLDGWPTEDTGQVTIRFASGAVGEILTSWALDVEGNRQFEVNAEFGVLAGSSIHLNHQLYGWPSASTRAFEPVDSFTAEIGHFIKVVRTGAPNPANIDIATRVLQVIKGAYLSASLGQTVALPEDPSADPVPGRSPETTPFSVDVLQDVLA